MRPSILPNLLAAAQRNADRGFANGALFEIGPFYKDDTPDGQIATATGLFLIGHGEPVQVAECRLCGWSERWDLTTDTTTDEAGGDAR